MRPWKLGASRRATGDGGERRDLSTEGRVLVKLGLVGSLLGGRSDFFHSHFVAARVDAVPLGILG